MESLLSIILIVFGVLQIILFFKVWGMTNNVKKISSYIYADKDLSYYILLGDRENLAKALEESMLKEISFSYKTIGFVNSRITNIPVKYMAIYKKHDIPFPEKYKKLSDAQSLRELLYN